MLRDPICINRVGVTLAPTRLGTDARPLVVPCALRGWRAEQRGDAAEIGLGIVLICALLVPTDARE